MKSKRSPRVRFAFVLSCLILGASLLPPVAAAFAPQSTPFSATEHHRSDSTRCANPTTCPETVLLGLIRQWEQASPLGVWFAFRAQENQDGINEKYQQWQNLSPQEQRRLRRRMEQLQSLPPQDQRLLQDRYHQWQKLQPSERKRLRRQLENPDSLSPQEQESIRRQFKFK